MKVLLLEGIHSYAHELLKNAGYEIESLPHALGEAELIERLQSGVAILGIRSKTQVSARALASAPGLLAIGCFCIGTNQVALDAARQVGVCVFNAPFGNTRSVAEKVIGEIIGLARQLSRKSAEMHAGEWRKSHEGCVEVRGKTLGIVGYGNIGSQVSGLAEALGMHVQFYDIVSKLTLGNAKSVPTLARLLESSDFVTLHVPETPLTRLMIGAAELARMKRGAYLINNSRGAVVDLDALAAALKSGALAGAAIDVFPVEPEKNGPGFVTPLQGIRNVMMTPHTGGATEEAQANIGAEVPVALMRYAEQGLTDRAVQFPRLALGPVIAGAHRLTNVHRNVPGVLRKINDAVAGCGANIVSQALGTEDEIGYVVIDTDRAISDTALATIERLPESIRTRALVRS